MVMSMMSHAELPLYLWGDAINTAQYLLNRVPSKAMIKTPYELWIGAKPKMEHMLPRTCPITATRKTQLQVKTRKNYSFVGYPSHSKGYCVYDHENKIILGS